MWEGWEETESELLEGETEEHTWRWEEAFEKERSRISTGVEQVRKGGVEKPSHLVAEMLQRIVSKCIYWDKEKERETVCKGLSIVLRRRKWIQGFKLIFGEIGSGGEDRDINHYWQSLEQTGTKYLFVFSDKEGP